MARWTNGGEKAIEVAARIMLALVLASTPLLARGEPPKAWSASFTCSADVKVPMPPDGPLVGVILGAEFTLEIAGAGGRWYEWSERKSGRLERVSGDTFRLSGADGLPQTLDRRSVQWVVQFAGRAGVVSFTGHCTKAPLRIPPESVEVRGPAVP